MVRKGWGPKAHSCVCAQLCLTLCGPMDCSLPGSSVPGIFQARILEWVAIRLLEDVHDPEIKPASAVSHALAGGFLTTSTIWEAHLLIAG